jgi:hypothetical protein
MTPADSTDWLFAAVALTTAATSSASVSAAEAVRAGVVTGAISTTRVFEQAPTNKADVVLGDSVRAGEEFQTGSEGVIHILFLDQSSVTLGPNSRLTLNSFSHDPVTRSGKIDMSLHEGAVRIVGGLNSKTNETVVHTADGEVGILGGISMVQTNDGTTTGTFLFGSKMRVQSNGGQTNTINRPGFSSTFSGNQVGGPQKAQPNQLQAMNNQFSTTQPTGGGTQTSTTPSGPTSGPLISTVDRPDGVTSPEGTLAGDRLSNPNSSLVRSGMTGSRPDSTFGENSSITIPNLIRTQPTAFTS